MASSCSDAVVVTIGSTRAPTARSLLKHRLQSQQLGDGGLDLRVAVAEALLLLEVSHDGRLGVDFGLDFGRIYWRCFDDAARLAERAVCVADPALERIADALVLRDEFAVDDRHLT